MSTIFISHSSSDNEFAQNVADFLIQRGHKSLFLDFDPEYGIIAGRNWEKELYSKLRLSQVVIILYSKKFSSSSWCFAEITHAKALGKHIIPIKIDNCPINSILTDVQVIDATTNLEEAFFRLEMGLSNAGVSKAAWDYSRPPYPGLLAFQEEDASVFFGRAIETEKLAEVPQAIPKFWRTKIIPRFGSFGKWQIFLNKSRCYSPIKK